MSVYTDLLAIARRQSQLVANGALEAAIALMDDRQRLLAGAGRPDQADLAAGHEVARLDRDLATALRHRMVALREEAIVLRQGRTALSGYRPPVGERHSRRLNAFS